MEAMRDLGTCTDGGSATAFVMHAPVRIVKDGGTCGDVKREGFGDEEVGERGGQEARSEDRTDQVRRATAKDRRAFQETGVRQAGPGAGNLGLVVAQRF